MKIRERAFTIKVPDGDGLFVSGILDIPNLNKSCPLAIIVPGFLGYIEWGFYPHLSGELLDKGFAVIRLNHSTGGIGNSGKPYSNLKALRDTTLRRDMDDIKLIIESLENGEIEGAGNIDFQRIGLAGHSKGGGVSILLAGETKKINAIVSISGVSNFIRAPKEKIDEILGKGYKAKRLPGTLIKIRINSRFWKDIISDPSKYDVLEAMKRLSVRTLLLHGGKDEKVSVAEAEALYNANPGMSELAVFPDLDHTLGCKPKAKKMSGSAEKLIKQAADWLSRNIQ
jgi:dipeptidyl aminopeptidase/acylaminoacyl peptidase